MLEHNDYSKPLHYYIQHFCNIITERTFLWNLSLSSIAIAVALLRNITAYYVSTLRGYFKLILQKYCDKMLLLLVVSIQRNNSREPIS